MKRWSRRLVLAGASAGVSVVLAEAAVRIVAPQDLSGSYRIATASGLLVNKSSGTARHQKGERVVRYAFSPPHLRDSRLVDGKRTVLCLGDSFTFGWLLAAQDTYVVRLEALANAELGEGFNFVNAAAAGWGTAECVAFVEELGARIRPDVVLVFVNFNDIGRSARRRLFTLAGGTGHELRRHPIEASTTKRVLNALPGYDWLLEHSHLAQLGRRAVHAPNREARVPEAVNVAASIQEDCIRLGQALFLRLKEWCDGHGARLLVTTTGFHVPDGGSSGFEPTRAFLAGADAFFQRHGIPFRDVSPELMAAMEGAPEDYLIPGDEHPNERGAALIADLVFRHFLREELEELEKPEPRK